MPKYMQVFLSIKNLNKLELFYKLFVLKAKGVGDEKQHTPYRLIDFTDYACLRQMRPDCGSICGPASSVVANCTGCPWMRRQAIEALNATGSSGVNRGLSADEESIPFISL